MIGDGHYPSTSDTGTSQLVTQFLEARLVPQGASQCCSDVSSSASPCQDTPADCKLCPVKTPDSSGHMRRGFWIAGFPPSRAEMQELASQRSAKRFEACNAPYAFFLTSLRMPLTARSQT